MQLGLARLALDCELVRQYLGSSDREASVIPGAVLLMPIVMSWQLPSRSSNFPAGQTQAFWEAEPRLLVVECLREESQRLQLVIPSSDFHFPFSQGSQVVPMSVSPALQVQEPSALATKVSRQTQVCANSLKVMCCGQS